MILFNDDDNNALKDSRNYPTVPPELQLKLIENRYRARNMVKNKVIGI